MFAILRGPFSEDSSRPPKNGRIIVLRLISKYVMLLINQIAIYLKGVPIFLLRVLLNQPLMKRLQALALKTITPCGSPKHIANFTLS